MTYFVTKESTIILSSYYCKSISNDLLLIYNKIIFSNYDLSDYLFFDYSNNDLKNLNNLIFFGSNFNEHIELPKNITHLTFCYSFNKSIVLPEKITHLTFGNNFNQPVVLHEK